MEIKNSPISSLQSLISFMNERFAELTQQLKKWNGRRRLRDGLLWLPRGLLIGLLLGMVVATIARFRPLLMNEEVAQAGQSGQSGQGEQAEGGGQGQGESQGSGQGQGQGSGQGSGEGNGQGQGSGSGSEQGGGTGGPGPGGGHTENVFVPDLVDLSQFEGEEIELSAECIANPAECGGLLSETPTEFGDEQSVVPYEQVFGDYRNAANEALADDYIPLGLKGYIRDYFSSLEP